MFRHPEEKSAELDAALSKIPIVALVNPKSGGGKGRRVLDGLQKLNNVEVVNILEFAKADTTNPDMMLKNIIEERENGPEKLRLVVGGGDGTVTWAFEILDRIEKSVPMAIIPLGTANEVSGCSGWKNSHDGKKLEKFIRRVRRGILFDIDLWHVDYHDGLEEPEQDDPKKEELKEYEPLQHKEEEPENVVPPARDEQKEPEESSLLRDNEEERDERKEQGGDTEKSEKVESSEPKSQNNKKDEVVANENKIKIEPSSSSKDKKSKKTSKEKSKSKKSKSKKSKNESSKEKEKVEPPARRPKTMIAFLSFGFDAKIAYRFHLDREDRDAPKSLLGNKMTYIKFGMKEIMSPYAPLNNKLEVQVDGNSTEFPKKDFRCLQVMNINSMADGVNFWGTAKSNSDDVLQEGEYTHPYLNDGKLEVVATPTVHHTNTIRVNIGHSIRVAQGTEITIRMLEPLHIEVDGEAWYNPEGKVKVTSMGKRIMIKGPYNTKSVRNGIKLPNDGDQAHDGQEGNDGMSLLCTPTSPSGESGGRRESFSGSQSKSVGFRKSK